MSSRKLLLAQNIHLNTQNIEGKANNCRG